MTFHARLLSTAVAATMLAMTSAGAFAQGYPNKQIRMVLPFAPGGGADLTTRTVAAKLQEKLGQPVIVDNRPGAGGLIAIQTVLQAPADGYTILSTTNGPITISPNLQQLPYDVTKDLTPIGMTAWGILGVAVNPGFPAKDMKELVQQAKTMKGGIKYATPGIGTQMHLAGELLKSQTGGDFTAVAYQGAGPAAMAVVTNDVPVAISDMTSLLGQADQGKVRILAVANSHRSQAAPNIPTIAEAGIPGFAADAWTGIMARSGTPADAINKLSAEIDAALAMPDVRETFLKAGLEPTTMKPDEMKKFIASELAKWGGVVKAANIKLQ